MSFERYKRTFGQDQTGDGSFGWLTVTMKGYTKADQDFVDLPVDVFWGSARPEIRIKADVNHPLAVDQREGISWDRAVELAILLCKTNKTKAKPTDQFREPE